MSKYTDAALKDMAQQTLDAEERGDMRSIQVYITVAVQMSMDPMAVREQIRRLADG